MKLRPAVRQALALFAAWAILMGLTALLDAYFGTITELLTVSWLCVGLLVMRARAIAFPLPSGDAIDLRGAFRTLWWAAFWPLYLRRK
jgi:hypothetical protein